MVGAVFLAKGVFQVVMGFQMRPHAGWGWMLTAGILSIIVGLIILIQWPVSTAYALGYLAGISLIFSGWSYVMIVARGEADLTAATCLPRAGRAAPPVCPSRCLRRRFEPVEQCVEPEPERRLVFGRLEVPVDRGHLGIGRARPPASGTGSAALWPLA